MGLRSGIRFASGQLYFLTIAPWALAADLLALDLISSAAAFAHKFSALLSIL